MGHWARQECLDSTTLSIQGMNTFPALKRIQGALPKHDLDETDLWDVYPQDKNFLHLLESVENPFTCWSHCELLLACPSMGLPPHQLAGICWDGQMPPISLVSSVRSCQHNPAFMDRPATSQKAAFGVRGQTGFLAARGTRVPTEAPDGSSALTPCTSQPPVNPPPQLATSVTWALCFPFRVVATKH